MILDYNNLVTKEIRNAFILIGIFVLTSKNNNILKEKFDSACIGTKWKFEQKDNDTLVLKHNDTNELFTFKNDKNSGKMNIKGKTSTIGGIELVGNKTVLTHDSGGAIYLKNENNRDGLSIHANYHHSQSPYNESGGRIFLQTPTSGTGKSVSSIACC